MQPPYHPNSDCQRNGRKMVCHRVLCYNSAIARHESSMIPRALDKGMCGVSIGFNSGSNQSAIFARDGDGFLNRYNTLRPQHWHTKLSHRRLRRLHPLPHPHECGSGHESPGVYFGPLRSKDSSYIWYPYPYGVHIARCTKLTPRKLSPRLAN